MLRAAAVGSPADGLDCVAIAVVVALGIGCSACRFAQHIVGVAIAPAFRLPRPFQRFFYRGAHHKLGAHDLHGVAHRGANNRLPQAPHGFLQQAELARVVFVVVVHHLAGQEQAPGRGVDEQ